MTVEKKEFVVVYYSLTANCLNCLSVQLVGGASEYYIINYWGSTLKANTQN